MSKKIFYCHECQGNDFPCKLEADANYKPERCPFTDGDIPAKWKSLFFDVKEILDAMPSEDRMELFGKYCKHCGERNQRCNCTKDE